VDFTSFQKLLGANVRHARHLAGKTQEEVDGVTLRYYQEIERGLRNPSVQVLFELAEQFGVTVADLVDAPGSRLSTPRLEKRKASAPRAGRKPKKGAKLGRGSRTD